MNYTLNQLQIFLKIVETKSITKAAAEMHMTQPSASIQLKNFQDQFDIPLTEVIGRKIYITDFGMEIAASAEKIINQINEINFKKYSYKGLLTGRLKITSVSTGKYVMPHFLSGFMKNNPGIELEMDVTNKYQVLEHLERNEVDFALVSIVPENIRVNKLDLLPNKLFLLGSAKEKFSSNEQLSELFKRVPLIYREDGSGTRLLMERFLDKNKISVQKKLELTSNEAVKQAVIAGLGCSIMPLIGLKNELLNKELQIIPTKGLPIKTMWSFVWTEEKKHSPVANALLSYLRENKNQIIQSNFKWSDQY